MPCPYLRLHPSGYVLTGCGLRMGMKKTQRKETNSFAITAAVNTIGELDIFRAEQALESLADEKGDRFVQNVLSSMPAVKLAAILRNHDETSPSIIHWLIPPKLAVSVLKIEPLFWENVRLDMGREDISVIQNNTARLVFTMLLIAKGPGGRSGLLEAIAEDDAALYYLYVPFFGWTPGEDLDPMFENTDVVWGGCDHLFEKIRFASPHTATLVAEYAKTPPVSLTRHIVDLWQNAVDAVNTGDRFDPIEESMFNPITMRRSHAA